MWFILVDTGNTILGKIILVFGSVYPCVYREHLLMPSPSSALGGLSLCIQGTQNPCYTIQKTQRFIPVYTGNTNSTKR